MSAPALTKVSGLPSLSLRLTKARFAIREGESLLYLASVLAYVIVSGLALTVAGGTWMFWNRWQHPSGIIAEVVSIDSSFEVILSSYFILALIACALLIPTLTSLASSAAVLGARGRERRLAALRLLGLSSADVTRMSLIDTLIQSGLGSLVGLVLYWATLPLWGFLTMEATPVNPAEMALPAWLIVAVLAAIIVIGLAASWWGLRQVRISPLGVARRSSRPGLRSRRVVAFVILIAAAFTVVTVAPPGTSIVSFATFGGVILVVVGGVNLIGPWLLQAFSRLLSNTGGATVMWAASRVQADPRQTWQRVGGIGLLSLIGGFMASMPITYTANETDDIIEQFTQGAQFDFTKGALITIAVGLALTAASILVTQASAVLERAEQSRALDKMGASPAFLTRVTWVETLGPLVVAILLGALAGRALGQPMLNIADSTGAQGSGLGLLIGILAAGIGLAMAALAATSPLQRQVLNRSQRAAD